MKLKPGQFYRTRAGVKRGPVERVPPCGLSAYPFKIGDSTYTAEGRIMTFQQTPEDLVSECACDKPMDQMTLADYRRRGVAIVLNGGRLP